MFYSVQPVYVSLTILNSLTTHVFLSAFNKFIYNMNFITFIIHSDFYNFYNILLLR